MNSDPEAHLAKVGRRFKSEWTKDDLQCVKFDTQTYLEGKAAVIMLSRPKKRNAWCEIMRNEIISCMEEANRNPKVRVIIITGDPASKAFCVGADLAPASKDNPTSIEGDVPLQRPPNVQYWRDGGGMTGLSVVRSLKPVICAVNGAAVGIGATLPTCCDISVGAKGEKVSYAFGKRGLAMECLSSFFLAKCVGHKIAMELVLTGRLINMENAPTGIFNHVVPKDQVLKKALEIAGEICETSAMSSMYNRNLIIRNSYGTSPEQAHLVESKIIYTALEQPDFMEGIMSFLEKRPAVYSQDPIKDSPEWFPWWQEVSVLSRL